MTESTLPWPGYRTAPEKFNLATEALDVPIARGCGDQVALNGDHGTITYASLQQSVSSLAASMIDLSLERGDLVLIKMSNSPEFASAFLAAVKLGIIPVLVNSLLSAGELQSVLEQAQPKLIFTETARADAVRELRQRGFDFQVVCVDGASKDEIAFESLTAKSIRSIAAADTDANEPALLVYTSC